ncbi:hypothetical protein FDP22_04695 [Paroceanicella profunda]|uniref:Glycosyltransferase family 4 protein n=1 Tax=Paroceanicella profunda TaxID=2579971 RepID=A0A5B8FVI1_9RHOB|nr:hypothetical protein [Paroceanicella profunda]QDL91140.1 hypothetical protein FDP22_04695 [Paroceanicella profunda]
MDPRARSPRAPGPVLSALRRAGPDGWLARALTSDSSPTADLYLVNSCSDMLATGRIRRPAPTVFETDDALLVMRHDARAPLTLARRRLVYFIDDAWRAAGADLSLSRFWRGKMKLVEGRAAAFYIPRAEHVVVSTEALLPAARAAAPQAALHCIDPYWSEPLADAAHFDEGEGLEIVFLGAQLHGADLAFLLPALGAVLKAVPQARFTLSAGHALPPDWEGHPQLRRIPGLRWRDYRAGLTGRRFHLALYPLLDTPFNAGRSRNKIIEHAVVGAAPLYSDTWPEGREAAAAGAGLALPNRPEDWAQALIRLAADRAALRALAAAARAHAEAINRPDRQRALWERLLFAPRPPEWG